MKHQPKKIMDDINQSLSEFSVFLMVVLVYLVYLLTLPFWIIPYLIYNHRKK